MSSSDQSVYRLAHVNRAYVIDSQNFNALDVVTASNGRLRAYNKFWNYYKGEHWTYPRETGEPPIVANFIQRFVDKHVQYLFGQAFTVHAPGSKTDSTEQFLNDLWDLNNVPLLGFEMGQVGGVTGDCWVNVGIGNDPINGEHIKFSVIPSQFVYPLFFKGTQRKYDALLIQWPEQEVVQSDFNSIRVRSIIRGQYWTRENYWDLVNNDAVGEPQKNILGEIPWVHIPNVPIGTEFWGRSDMSAIVELNREYNEKMTDISDIVNYHAAPVTIIFGAKASNLERGPRKVWSGLPVTARVENLQLNGDLAAANTHLGNLKQTIFELGEMSSTAFGGAEAISNTSGVALAIQYAPMMEHMRVRRLTYGEGIRNLNYFAMRFGEVMGTFRANGGPKPYLTYVKWPNPLPRDKNIELQNLIQMKQIQVLARSQILRQLINEEIAPAFLEETDADALVEQAIQEEVKYTQLMTEAGTPPEPPTDPGVNPDAAAERASQKQQQVAETQAQV